uniref:Uncharacterized protein n=1 Tax=Falco tinnunculus TaxID=100819 RepID=A0A8C4UE39_FALTI
MGETAWNVSVSIWGLQLRLHLTSSIPTAFSAALCQRRSGQCEAEAPLYTVTQPEGSAPGELALLLPVQVLGSCVLVWRSDVRFARKQLLCPDGEWRSAGGMGGGGGGQRPTPHCPSPSLPQALWAAGPGTGAGAGGDCAASQLPRHLEAG